MPGGYPWATGDELLANDLNAAFANSAEISGPPGSTAGWPFLPLSGGTVTGPTTFAVQTNASSFYAGMGNTMTFAGAQPITQYGFLYVGNLAGTAAAGANVNYITIPTDNVALPANSTGLSWFSVGGNFGGSQMSGSRAGASFNIHYVGPNVSATDGDRQWQASFNQFNASASAGGTSPHLGSSAGYGYGSGDLALLLAGATNWSGIIGHEIDVGIATGASAAARQGLLIISYSNVQGTDYDQGIVIAAASGAPGWVQALSLGPGALDPTNGIVLGYQPGAPANPTARRGIDLSAYTFSDSAFLSTGFTVSGSGHVAIGNGVDCGAQIGASAIDTSKHLTLNTFGYGIGVTNNRINYVVPANSAHVFSDAGADQMSIGVGVVNMLNTTANIINFGSNGFASPTFTTRSAGAKVIIFPGLSGTAADMAVGVEPNAMWFGVRTTGDGFHWYGGTTVAAALSGLGALSLVSGIGAWNTTPPAAKPTVTGAKGSNAALASLMTALAAYGLVTDSTTA